MKKIILSLSLLLLAFSGLAQGQADSTSLGMAYIDSNLTAGSQIAPPPPQFYYVANRRGFCMIHNDRDVAWLLIYSPSCVIKVYY